MNLRPLGEYEQPLGSTARPWSAGTVVHGSGVLDDLLAGLARHISTDWSAEYWRRLEPRVAAIGCVAWLTDRAVAEALASFDQCCVVVDKQQPEYDAVRRLASDGKPLSSAHAPRQNAGPWRDHLLRGRRDVRRRHFEVPSEVNLDWGQPTGLRQLAVISSSACGRATPTSCGTTTSTCYR